jgi:hypothetical protein
VAIELVSAEIAWPPMKTLIAAPLEASVVTRLAASVATDKGAISAQSTTTEPPLIPSTY